MRSFYVEILPKCSLEFDRLQQHLEQKKKHHNTVLKLKGI